MTLGAHKAIHSLVLALACAALVACGGGSSGGGSSGGGGGGTPPVAPVFTSGLVATTLEGNTGTVYTAQATVASGYTATYSVSGTDASQFNINSSTGAVSFKGAPSYSSPTDASGENDYLITVSVSDGTNTVSQGVSILVAQNISARAYTFTNATWGGGGYVSGFIYHPSVQGLVYVRTDIGGAYRRDPGSSTWVPLNDDLTYGDSQLMGVLSLAVDPNDSQKLYLAVGEYLPSWAENAAILRSNDRGATWSRTALPIKLGGNSDGRGAGERLMVDPNKGSILFLGTNQDGLYTSIDSGVTWSKVSSFTPTSTNFVLFDKSTGAHGSATQTIYAGVNDVTNHSLYRSTDGGATWTAVPGQPAGLMPLRGAFDGNGHLYLTYANALGPNSVTDGAVYKLTTATNSWTNVTPSAPGSIQFGYSGVSIDAHDPNTVMVSTIDRWATGDDIYRSTDGGNSWTGLNSNSSHVAPNNPWVVASSGGALAGKMGGWITDVEIDPFNSASAMYQGGGSGGGIWETHNLTASGTVNWSFNCAGLEETAVMKVVSPKSGAHALEVLGDVGGGRYTTLTSSDVNGFFIDPDTTNPSLDVAELNPNIVARTAWKSWGGYISTDNGVSWSHMPSTPVISGSDPGQIAISATATAMLWVPGGKGAYYSANNGASWTASSGYPVVSGYTFAPVADRAVNGYFYTYDTSTGTILESNNSGQTFASAVTGLPTVPTYEVSQLLSMPGIKRRDLWAVAYSGLYHIDGVNSSPVQITSVQEAYALGYGSPAPGQSYYALYLVGKVGGVQGIFRSDDAGATWIEISDTRHKFNYIGTITGDPRIYGRVYFGAGGRGLMVGNR